MWADDRDLIYVIINVQQFPWNESIQEEEERILVSLFIQKRKKKLYYSRKAFIILIFWAVAKREV